MKGLVTEKEGPHNFMVEIILSAQLTKWKGDIDQLRKCTDTSDSHDTSSDSTLVSPQEKEEEEKQDNSDVLYSSYMVVSLQHLSSPVVRW